MAKHFKDSNDDDAPKTVFLGPCGDCWDGMTICKGYDEDSTLTRVFSNYGDALSYVRACGWCCIEDSIVEVTVGCL